MRIPTVRRALAGLATLTALVASASVIATPAAAARAGTAAVTSVFQFGTPGTDAVTGIIGKLGSPDYRVLGTTTGTFPGRTNAGGTDAYVRDVTSAGTTVRQFGTAGDDTITAEVGTIDAGSTTGGVPGHTNLGETDGYVWAFDKGHTVWATQIGTSAQDTVVAIGRGNYGIYALGTTTGTFAGQTGKGGTDYFIALLDKTTGALEAVHQYGTSGDDRVVSMTVLPENLGRCCGYVDEVVVAGDTTGTFSKNTAKGARDLFIDDVTDPFDPSPVSETITQFGTSGDDQALAGDAYTIAGTTTGVFPGQVNHGGYDAFVARPTSPPAYGGAAWAYEFGTSGTDRATAVRATRQYYYNSPLSYLVAGDTTGALPGQRSNGGADAFELRVDTGGLRWRIQTGGPGADSATAIAGSARGTLVGGRTTGIHGPYRGGESDAFLARVNLSKVDVSIFEGAPTYVDVGGGRLGGPTGAYPLGAKAKVGRIEIVNGGEQSEPLALKGCPDTTVFTVRYYDGSGDVTTAVRKGTYTVPTTVLNVSEVSMRLTPKEGSKAGQHARCAITLTSTTNPTVYDDVVVSVGR